MKKADATSSKSVAPFIEKIERLTKAQRIGTYVLVMVAIIGVSGWFFIKPKYEKIDQLQKQLVQVQAELEKAKTNARELNDWRSKMKKKEAEYKTVMRALPEKEEIPSLLAGISQAGKDAGLEFLLFQPKPEVAKDFYAEIPVDINVSGSYHQVAAFFDKVANLPRIVNIRDSKMAPQSSDKGNTLTTVCQAVTYKFIDQAEPKTKPGTKKAKAAPAK